jgi:hypothetical protein
MMTVCGLKQEVCQQVHNVFVLLGQVLLMLLLQWLRRQSMHYRLFKQQ